MSHTANIQLADIRILQSFHDSLSFGFPPEYDAFIKDPAPADLPVDICIELRRDPVTYCWERMKKQFDTEESWSAYVTEEGEYIFALSPPALSGRTVWAAHCSGDFRSVRIYLPDKFQNKMHEITGGLFHAV